MSKKPTQCYRCGCTPCDCHDDFATPEQLAAVKKFFEPKEAKPAVTYITASWNDGSEVVFYPGNLSEATALSDHQDITANQCLECGYTGYFHVCPKCGGKELNEIIEAHFKVCEFCRYSYGRQ